jgi:Fe-S cluster assembly ATP-binding protein
VIIQNISISVDNKQVVQDLSLSIAAGTIHALMGPNGSGKSSLASTIMGHPQYVVTGGSIVWQGTDITALEPHERARKGLFLAVQYPPAIPGVRIKALLLQAARAIQGSTFNMAAFEVAFKEAMDLLILNPTLCERGLHDGFSGGEKKRLELLQMLVLNPAFIIFDEIDSGLDIDGVKLVGTVLAHIKAKNPTVSILIITHYQRMLEYVIPDYVHVLHKGSIVETGTAALVHTLERRGYNAYK